MRAGAVLAAGAALLALLPLSLSLRTPQSRLDDVTAVAAAVRTTGKGADGILYLPGRRRVWSPVEPDSVSGLRDLALERGPADSGTLYGTEAAPLRHPLPGPGGPPDRRTARSGGAAAGPGRPGEDEAAVLAGHFEECGECGTVAARGARISVYARPGSC